MTEAAIILGAFLVISVAGLWFTNELMNLIRLMEYRSTVEQRHDTEIRCLRERVAELEKKCP